MTIISPTICLNMIVRNEAHVIRSTLENISSYFSIHTYVICDTGSTDETKSIIQDFFDSKGMDGLLLDHVWIDFGTNRTKALQEAFNKSDYVLLFDADDAIHGDFILPEVLNKEKYCLQFGKGFTYIRPLLISNRIQWKFVGVLHEYLALQDESLVCKEETIQGNYHVDSGKSGFRSKNPKKYWEDAQLLEEHYSLEITQNPSLAARYAFYCAQSYKDFGDDSKAIEWYKKCIGNPVQWEQERYVSAIYLGDLYDKLGKPEKSIHYYLKGSTYDAQRYEGIVKAVAILSKREEHVLVHSLCQKYSGWIVRPDSSKLFLMEDCYTRGLLEFYDSISAYYCGFPELGLEALCKILQTRQLSLSLQKLVLQNLSFFLHLIPKDNLVQDFFYRVQEMMNVIPKNELTTPHFKVWNFLFENSEKEFTTTPTFPLHFQNLKHPFLIMTITCCKRLSLFIKTMNSFLNHCTDVHRIDYWFCVDDNSSQEDRQEMKRLYPWMDFYWKSDQEIGHRKSMNIIWQKLNQLRPNYWLQMEDDFCFFQKMPYLSEAIRGLDRLRSSSHQVCQIVFNRNYAEIVEDYEMSGHLVHESGFLIHQHISNPKEIPQHYKNYHYWPHFSFRPSLIDCETILKLGNFDSPNTFFERDYADKFNKAGYKTAFFPFMTAKHIGKLTWQKNIPNAYSLNGQSQF